MSELFNLDLFSGKSAIYSFTGFHATHHGRELQRNIMREMFGPTQKVDTGHEKTRAIILPQIFSKISEKDASNLIKDIISYKILPTSGNFAYYKISKLDTSISAELVIPVPDRDPSAMKARMIDASAHVREVEKSIFESKDYLRLFDNYKEEFSILSSLRTQQKYKDTAVQKIIVDGLAYEIAKIIQDELNKSTEKLVKQIKSYVFA